VTEYESLPQQAQLVCSITVQNFDWRMVRNVFYDGITNPLELDILFDGTSLMLRGTKGTELLSRDLTVTGLRMPFTESFTIDVNGMPAWLRSQNREPLTLSLVLRSGTGFVSLDGINPSNRGNWRSNMDIEITKMDYHIAVPYKALRQQVLDNSGLLVSVHQNRVGLYSPDGGQVDFSTKDIEKMRLFSTQCDAAVGFITKKDVLKRLTRGGVRTGDTAFIGFRGPDVFIGFNRGKTYVWSRLDRGAYRPSPPIRHGEKFSYVRLVPALYEPYLVLREMAEWTVRMKSPNEEEEMTEDEKKTVRAWWSAFISQQARLGEEIAPEHHEAAEKFLS
jgi:hypothetical protein